MTFDNTNNWWDHVPTEYSCSESPSLFYNNNNYRNNGEFFHSYKHNYQQPYESALGEHVNSFNSATPPRHPSPQFLLNQSFVAGGYNNRFGSQSSSAVIYPGVDVEAYAPCQGPKPWDYSHCYGYYGQQPCQYIDVVDIEDFMSNEKRKEKSRDAARCRRSRETEIFTELGQVLPLQKEEVEQLDKASIMRLSIAYLKVRETLKLFPDVENLSLLPSEDDKIVEPEQKPFSLLTQNEVYKLMSLALDGFLMMLSSDGDVIYVSETISEYLGISQIDILGQQIWEYTHQCDHDELKEALNVRRISSDKKCDDKKEKSMNGSSTVNTAHRDFFLRLKCTLTSRGRSVNIKSASYKVIHVTGHMSMNSEGDRILIAVGRPLPHPSNIEIPLGSTTFLTKHSLDMKFTYVDDKMLSVFGYQPEDLLGTSLYECHHGADSESLMTTFKSVLSKGQSETCRYRFLGKCGGYCWVITQATVVYDKQKPQSVVCVNYAISEIENNNEIYSCAQLEAYRQNKQIAVKEKDDQQQQEYNNQSKNHHIEKQADKKQQIQNNDDNTNNNECHLIKKSQLKQDNLENNNNNNNNDENKSNVGILNTPKKRDEISLSPIRRTFNNCSISVTKSYEKRPKSVTASVFTQVPITNEQQYTTSQTINTTTVTILNQQPTKAQSVTASVLTPISSLSNRINRSFLSGNTSKFLSRSTSGTVGSTEEMSKGYLMFSEETPDLTMLKEEEPDDLTHLAPTAGDACIPLDESTPLFGEMLESLIMPDAYGTLLTDDINSLDSQQSNCNNNSNNKNHQIDPFIHFRDESNDTSNSPHLLSPGSASKSPEMSSLPSLCSPNSLSQDDEFAFMTMNVEDDIDLTMRAPYIPMNEQEDLPLLTEDLMWSAFSEELSLHKDIKEALQMEAMKNNQSTALSNRSNSINNSSSNQGSSESSLAALLCGNSIQHDDPSASLNDASDNKKRKILLSTENPTNNLVESVDEYGPIFNKTASNVDCWTMNDLLQINTTNVSTLQQEIRPKKQNITVNTAISGTIHMPLLAIQNKNSNNAKLSCINVLSNSNLTTASTSKNDFGHSTTSNNSNTMKKLSTTSLKSVNTNLNSGSSMSSKNSNNLNSGGIITASCSSKRPSNIILSTDTKRVKNSSAIEKPTSPQLLQQLMAPVPQRSRTKLPYDKISTSRWNCDVDGQQSTNPSTSVQSSSNSVLKNLLVSGCDVSQEAFTLQSPIFEEAQIQRSLQNSPEQSFFIRPLTCTTSTGQIMRHCGTNPLIGGIGILPSPPIPIDAEDGGGGIGSMEPLIAGNFSPGGSDSDGTKNLGTSINLSNPTKVAFLLNASNKMDISLSDEPNKMQVDLAVGKTDQSRKMSFSFLDDDNPLCSPFLMDLCNDDYNMDGTLAGDFLQENEITKVLNDWTTNITA